VLKLFEYVSSTLWHVHVLD